MEELIERFVVDLGASSGVIMVVDEEAKVLRCRASFNMPQVWVDLVNKLETGPGNTNGTVACTGEASIENNLNETFHGHFLDSVIVVPVKNSDTVVANIEIIRDKPDRTFNSADQEYLEAHAEAVRELL